MGTLFKTRKIVIGEIPSSTTTSKGAIVMKINQIRYTPIFHAMEALWSVELVKQRLGRIASSQAKLQWTES